MRVPSVTKLRTSEEYLEREGELVTAPDYAHRTHEADSDPVVATFDALITAEEAEVRSFAALVSRIFNSQTASELNRFCVCLGADHYQHRKTDHAPRWCHHGRRQVGAPL